MKINIDTDYGYAKIKVGSGQSALREARTQSFMGGECRVVLTIYSKCSPRNRILKSPLGGDFSLWKSFYILCLNRIKLCYNDYVYHGV